MKTTLKARELSIEDARYLLGSISRMTIYQLLNDGELASVLIGQRRFISTAAITAFIATSSTNVAPSEHRARAGARQGIDPRPLDRHRRGASGAGPRQAIGARAMA
jgi:excisionase family DNA binding protein